MDSNSYRLKRWKPKDNTHNSKMEEIGSANCLTFKIRAWGLLDSKRPHNLPGQPTNIIDMQGKYCMSTKSVHK